MSKIDEAEIRRRLELLSGLQPSAQATDRALERVRKTLRSTERLHARKSFWRIVMESKWSRLAAAAGIVLAVLIGLNLTGRQGVAWARLMENVTQVRSCVYRMRMTIDRPDQPDADIEFIMYLSSEHGIRRDAYIGGNVATQVYVPPDATHGIEVVPPRRQYVNLTFTEAQRAKLTERNDPRELVRHLMSFDHKALGVRTIAGRECEGIEVDDPRFGRALFERGTGRLWADVETDLPVLMEFEGTSAGGSVRTRLVFDEFVWEAPLTVGDFEPNIPADYTVMADVDLSASEQTVIEGLRAFASVTGGAYPSSLDLITSMREVRHAFMIERRKRGVSVEQEPTKEELESVLAIQAVCMYYGQLMSQDKDVAYHGDKVSADFGHAVLLRWRVDEETYRAILGDLTVQDVAPERLAELEALPLNTERRAVDPEPAPGVIGAAVEGLRLTWLPGAGAVEHRVYFGDDAEDLALLAAATETPPVDLPVLERETTYFWRVDEVDADGAVTPGDLWNFSTGRLVGWWKLDESEGRTAADAAGNGHVGTLVGDPTWTPGVVGGALAFDGEGDYVDLGTAPDFDITSQITVVAWVKVSAFDVEWQTIISKGDVGWRLSRGMANNVHFACTGLWPEWVHGDVEVDDGQWHHVAGTYDGRELRLYVNGAVDASAATYGLINVNDYPVYLGENAEHPGREWNGLVDDVRLYNYALSEAEIKALHASRSQRP